MTIRDAIQRAAEAVLSELLVPSAAKELARQIGERAERQVIASITGGTGDAAPRRPRAKAARRVPKGEGKSKTTGKTTTKAAKADTKTDAKTEPRRRKPRKRTNGVHADHGAQPAAPNLAAVAAVASEGTPAVPEGNVVPISGSAPVQTADQDKGLGL
jgi:hypothetical protein